MKLELYKFDSCPYCRRVMNFIEIVGRTDIEYHDIHKNAADRERLIRDSGMEQVPCLFIDGTPLYESLDIIRWLEEHPERIQLYEGRPDNEDGRLGKELRVYDLLDRLDIHYLRTDHEPADTMEACNRIDAVLDVVICKNLFLCNRKKTKYYLLLMPGNKPFRTKELAGQHGIQRLSFASPEYMEKYLDITPGAVSVMGLMNDTENAVQLLIDEDLIGAENFGCHPCVNTSSLKMKMQDVMEVFLPAVHHEALYVNLKGGEE